MMYIIRATRTRGTIWWWYEHDEWRPSWVGYYLTVTHLVRLHIILVCIIIEIIRYNKYCTCCITYMTRIEGGMLAGMLVYCIHTSERVKTYFLHRNSRGHTYRYWLIDDVARGNLSILLFWWYLLHLYLMAGHLWGIAKQYFFVDGLVGLIVFFLLINFIIIIINVLFIWIPLQPILILKETWDRRKNVKFRLSKKKKKEEKINPTLDPKNHVFSLECQNLYYGTLPKISTLEAIPFMIPVVWDPQALYGSVLHDTFSSTKTSLYYSLLWCLPLSAQIT